MLKQFKYPINLNKNCMRLLTTSVFKGKQCQFDAAIIYQIQSLINVENINARKTEWRSKIKT